MNITINGEVLDMKDNNQKAKTSDLIVGLIIWVLIILAVFFIGKWILSLMVGAYHWTLNAYIDLRNFFANLWYDAENIFGTIIVISLALLINKHGGSTLVSKLFPKESGDDIKRRYSNNSYSGHQDNTRYTHRVRGEDGYYHNVTTDKYGGGARDEYGRSGTIHDHEFHRN